MSLTASCRKNTLGRYSSNVVLRRLFYLILKKYVFGKSVEKQRRKAKGSSLEDELDSQLP